MTDESADRAGLDASEERLHVGMSLGPYVLDRRLGQGGFCYAIAARQARTGAQVVLKVVRRFRRERQDLARLLREAEVLRTLDHPGVVRCLDSGVWGGWGFLALPFYPDTLRDRLLRGPLSLSEARRVFGGLLEALGHVHERGVVHRDVKARNVLLSAAGDPVLSDLGSALTPEDRERSEGSPSGFSGTRGRAAPEQERDASQVDGRADLFGLGLVVLEAFHGRPPGPLHRVLDSLLAPDPADRYPDAERAREALLAALSRSAREDG